MKPSNVQIKQLTQIGQTGAVTYLYSVSFMVGQHGPFTLTFAQADFTPAKVTAALTDFAANIQQIAGTAA